MSRPVMREPESTWSVNDAATSQPITDDPWEVFAAVDDVRDLTEDLDEHLRFLIGDWPH
jgi:hypothetical protein